MTHLICRLTAKSWDQLRNPTLGSRVWATFTFSARYAYIFRVTEVTWVWLYVCVAVECSAGRRLFCEDVWLWSGTLTLTDHRRSAGRPQLDWVCRHTLVSCSGDSPRFSPVRAHQEVSVWQPFKRASEKEFWAIICSSIHHRFLLWTYWTQSVPLTHITLYDSTLNHTFSKQCSMRPSGKLQCFSFTYVTD